MDFNIEASYYRAGYRYIAGIDEAGRGALAGPVVAAAVVLPQKESLIPLGIKDSKLLSAKKRQALFWKIRRSALAVGVGIATRIEVDCINILQASLIAMKRAVEGIERDCDLLLVDGKNPMPIEIEQQCLIGGDRHCVSIAAASIIAKVTRDKIMSDLHSHFPRYGFDRHMGYGTLQHRQNLQNFGPCPEHRLSFRGVIL